VSVCLSCLHWGRGPLCHVCAAGLREVPPSTLPSGLCVIAAFSHEGAARRLVHRLKYEGMVTAADVLSEAMALLLPAGTAALVPVPRATLRRMRYGTDQARTLARLVGARAGVPVVSALRAEMWWPAHAGSSRAARRSPRFRGVAKVPRDSVLVDDVFTTGVTLAAAAEAIGVSRALTATRAGRI